MESAPICPASGLLRSRCRCSDPACYGRPNATERRESGGHRRGRLRRQKKREQRELEQKLMVKRAQRNHALEHPEMWSPGFAERTTKEIRDAGGRVY